MSFRFLLRSISAAVLLVPLTAGLSGCGSDSAAPATTLNITPSLGLVRNATVVVKNAAGNVVGTGVTGTNGTVTITASGTAPFVIEVQGDNVDAEYFDESTGLFVPFAAGRSIHALVPTGSTNVGVTGLTDIAHALLMANSATAPLTDTNINLANDAVLQTFAPSAPEGFNNLLTPPQLVGATQTAAYLVGDAAGMYAAILAGLAETGAGEATPALTAIEQLRRDASDGIFDGNEGTTAISNLVYTPGTFTTDFRSQVSTVINAWGRPGLVPTASTYNVTVLAEPTWVTTGGGGGGGDLPATVHTGLLGTYTLTFQLGSGIAASATTFSDGTNYPATIAAGGSLTINGVNITQPFYRSIGGVAQTGEAVWYDPVNRIEFAVSNNTSGVFNEINLFNPYPANGTGIPEFLGQFTVASSGGGAATITSMSPASGATGANVIINGTGFGTDPFHVVVLFSNNIAATVTSVSNDEINVTVPAGAVDGPISVAINGGTPVVSTASFDVTAATGGGDSWTARAKSTSALLNGIAFGNNTFVSVGAINTVQTSADGLSWANATLSTADKNGWYTASNVVFDGTRFVMIGDTINAPTVSPMIATSTDGVAWTRRSWIPMSTQYQLSDIAAGNGTLTIVGGDAIANSTDGGVTWNNEEQPSTGYIGSLRGVASSGSVRVAVGRSNNGILVNSGSGWTSAATGLTDFCPSDVVWSGEFFLAVGGSDCNFGASAVVMQSQNGNIWTRYALDTAAAPAGYDLRGAFTHSDGRIYAVGGNGMQGHLIVSSANGSTWTREIQGNVTAGQGQLVAIAASAARMVAVGGVSNLTKP